MNYPLTKLWLAPPAELADVVIQGLRQEDWEQVRQAHELLVAHFLERLLAHNFAACDEVGTVLLKLFDALPTETPPLSKVQTYQAAWETLLALLQSARRVQSAEQGRRVLKSLKHGERLLRVVAQRAAVSPSELAEALGLTPPNVSNLLSRMEEAGLVVRRAAGRNVWVALGPVGHEIAEERRSLPVFEVAAETLRVLLAARRDSARTRGALAAELVEQHGLDERIAADVVTTLLAPLCEERLLESVGEAYARPTTRGDRSASRDRADCFSSPARPSWEDWRRTGTYG
jgi:DNA-binding MarR family transcriptional regulator